MQGRLVSKLVKPRYSALQDIGQNSILYKGFHGSKHVNNIGSLDQNLYALLAEFCYKQCAIARFHCIIINIKKILSFSLLQYLKQQRVRWLSFIIPILACVVASWMSCPTAQRIWCTSEKTR